MFFKVKIKFQIYKFFVRLEQNWNFSNQITKKTVFKILFNLLPDSTNKMRQKIFQSFLPIFNTEEGFEAET